MTPDCVKVLDLHGNLNFMSENGMCAMEIDDFFKVVGHKWWDLWPEESQSFVKSAFERARAGEIVQFEAGCPTMKHNMRCWDVTVRAIYCPNGRVDKILAVSRDVSGQRSGCAPCGGCLCRYGAN
nr:PAS domain-containing protein [Pseudaestuariivita rosea]